MTLATISPTTRGRLKPPAKVAAVKSTDPNAERLNVLMTLDGFVFRAARELVHLEQGEVADAIDMKGGSVSLIESRAAPAARHATLLLLDAALQKAGAYIVNANIIVRRKPGGPLPSMNGATAAPAAKPAPVAEMTDDDQF